MYKRYVLELGTLQYEPDNVSKDISSMFILFINIFGNDKRDLLELGTLQYEPDNVSSMFILFINIFGNDFNLLCTFLGELMTLA